MNKWKHEELAYLQNYGQKLVGCDCFEGKVVLVFEDFSIRMIDL
jgi:hypothetical protein